MIRDGYPRQEDVIKFICGKKVPGREFNGCPIAFELDDLSCHQYALGEGYDLVLHVTLFVLTLFLHLWKIVIMSDDLLFDCCLF